MAFDWTNDRVAELKRLYDAKLSCAQIAAEMTDGSLTRNAVIGKVHRLGLERRGRTFHSKQPKVRLVRPRRIHAYSVLPTDIEPAHVELREAVEATPLHIDLHALNKSTCHFPYGDGPFTFCGCLALPDKPYCHAHDQITHGAGTHSERAATKIRLAA